MGDYNDFSQEDFGPEVFKDPIAMLEALKRKKKSLNATAALEQNDCVYESKVPSDELLSMSDIERRYHVSIEALRLAIKTKTLVPVASIPLFSSEDVMRFIEGANTLIPTIVATFLEEIEHMRTNYSYKPLLLMAIFEKANENGEISMTDIVDYYSDFYRERSKRGLKPEKSDSSFVKRAGDRQAAKRTIVNYPLRIYIRKGFLSYDSSSNVVKVNQILWKYVLESDRVPVMERCKEALDRYYLTAFS